MKLQRFTSYESEEAIVEIAKELIKRTVASHIAALPCINRIAAGILARHIVEADEEKRIAEIHLNNNSIVLIEAPRCTIGFGAIIIDHSREPPS